jgi:hypothetical protein
MKVLSAAIVVALLAGPVYGQEQEHMQQYREETPPKSASQMQADRAAERAYKNSLSNIPDAGPVDPWGNARTVPKAAAKEPVKPAAKTAAAKAAPVKPKTNSAAN